MNILVVVAHPDDEVLGMGGTILKHANQGDKVTVAYLATGITSRRSSNYQNISSYTTNKKEETSMSRQIKKLRNDAKKVCKFLKVKKLILENKPERIYTSHHGDLNIDHKIMFEATLAACKPTELPVKEIICFELLSSTEWSFSYKFKPNYFINIKNELDEKIKAMQMYKNEIRKYPHPRSSESIKNSAYRWGAASGCYSAEAFEIIRKIEK